MLLGAKLDAVGDLGGNWAVGLVILLCSPILQLGEEFQRLGQKGSRSLPKRFFTDKTCKIEDGASIHIAAVTVV